MEYWLDSELLNHKTTDHHYKNRIVLFDILWAGKYLFKGPTTFERQEMLYSLCGNPQECEGKYGLALVVSDNIWLAENFEAADFIMEYKRHLDKDQIEGIVLKQKDARITNLGQSESESEVAWQLRCRKPHKNYAF